MAAPYDRAQLVETQDQLLSLLARYDEAFKGRDWPAMDTINGQIEMARAHRDAIRTWLRRDT
jgi:hypothetical protein